MSRVASFVLRIALSTFSISGFTQDFHFDVPPSQACGALLAKLAIVNTAISNLDDGKKNELMGRCQSTYLNCTQLMMHDKQCLPYNQIRESDVKNVIQARALMNTSGNILQNSQAALVTLQVAEQNILSVRSQCISLSDQCAQEGFSFEVGPNNQQTISCNSFEIRKCDHFQLMLPFIQTDLEMFFRIKSALEQRISLVSSE